jgi:hypothetical protein
MHNNRVPFAEDFSFWKETHFDKGFAVYESRILTDTVYCRFRNEEFVFPSSTKGLSALLQWGPLDANDKRYPANGVPVKKLRSFAKNLEKKNGRL